MSSWVIKTIRNLMYVVFALMSGFIMVALAIGATDIFTQMPRVLFWALVVAAVIILVLDAYIDKHSSKH